jgi:hypothetical protein
MQANFEVHVNGRLPRALTDAINSRFSAIAIRNQPTSTLLEGRIPDQAALRALLGLIWDTDSNVLSVTFDPETVP